MLLVVLFESTTTNNLKRELTKRT